MNRPRTSRSLFRIVSQPVVAFGVAAMIIQTIVVFWEYFRDTSELARLMVEQETSALSEGIFHREGNLRYELPPALERYASAGSGYFARVQLDSGDVLFSSCTELCAEQYLPVDRDPPDFWQQQLSSGKPISVAGGRTFKKDGRRLSVELAVLGDRRGRMWAVLGHEIADHMIVPMGLMLVLVLGGALWSVRRSLKPVTAAARHAHGLDPRNPGIRLVPDGMPTEVGDLVNAINAAFARIGHLIDAQKVFTSAVGHELRTPLAAMKLDLGRIDHPRARQAEAEIERLSHFVDQVTALARLEAENVGQSIRADLVRLCKSRVMALADWVYRNDHSIEFRDKGATQIPGREVLLENAVGNLIENAVRHTPRGTHVTVEAGPGARIRIINSVPIGQEGSLQVDATVRKDRLGLGLQIVKRIAALHGADFTLSSAGGQTIAELDFTHATSSIGKNLTKSTTETGGNSL